MSTHSFFARPILTRGWSFVDALKALGSIKPRYCKSFATLATTLPIRSNDYELLNGRRMHLLVVVLTDRDVRPCFCLAVFDIWTHKHNHARR